MKWCGARERLTVVDYDACVCADSRIHRFCVFRSAASLVAAAVGGNSRALGRAAGAAVALAGAAAWINVYRREAGGQRLAGLHYARFSLCLAYTSRVDLRFANCLPCTSVTSPSRELHLVNPGVYRSGCARDVELKLHAHV